MEPSPAFQLPHKDALLAGAVGGLCVSLVGAPFDLVKVRQQLSTATSNLKCSSTPLNSNASSALSVAKVVLKTEGVRGFWRGVLPAVISAAPIYAVVFSAFEINRTAVLRIRQRLDKSSSSWLKSTPRTLREQGTFDIAISGALVGLPTSLLYCPMDRIKCLLQNDGQRISNGFQPQYKSTLDCMRKVPRTGGIRSLYRGYLMTMMRDIPGWSVYFTVYQAMRTKIAKATSAEEPALLDGSEALSPASIILAGGLAGCATWAVAIPMDVIKTQWQTNDQFMSYRQVIRSCVKRGGFASLLAGFWTIVLGGLPRDSAGFLGVEATQRLLFVEEKIKRSV